MRQSLAQPLTTNIEKYLGAATSSYLFRDLNRYWNQLTPGNDGKWGSVSSTRGSYNWTNLDAIYDYAISRGLLYRHHVLVWGSQQPSWIASLDSATQRAEVEKWFQLVGQRYPQMAFAEVVNEPFHTPLPTYRNALGGNGTTGWDWVITAFQLARKYMPATAKLLINEYNVLHDNTATTNYLNLINLLKDRGLLDGICIQGHYFEFRSDISASSQYIYNINTIKNNLNSFTATGLPVYISEFDIDETVDANQLEQMKIYFPVFWDNPGVKGITFWGYIEYDVWTSHPNTYLLRSNESERPALQWIRSFIYSPKPPVLISPVTVLGVPRNPKLIWHRSDSASSYHIQVTSNSLFTTVFLDTTVTDTLLQLKLLDAYSRYYWRVSGVNAYGEGSFSPAAGFQTGDLISGTEEQQAIPMNFSLAQNYPNPFNPSTTIEFSLPIESKVKLSVFDLLGREVAVLVDDNKSAGTYRTTWDEKGFSSGMYYYRLQAGEFVQTKKLLLLK
ncbi:MAG: endo-1,4-beta-xylanase [bacterium]